VAKVCYLTVQWLEQARYTADNLLIAKLMSDYGLPLSPELSFYVESYSNEPSLFFEAIKLLFPVKSDVEEKEEDEKTIIHVANQEIGNWLGISEKCRNTSMYEAFRMAQVGLESQLASFSDHFDGELKGEFEADGFQLVLNGTQDFMLYHEFLEIIFQFLAELKKQLHIWEDLYNEHFARNQRNAYNAS
jgi:hypothetical protein